MEKELWFTNVYDTYAEAIWRYFVVRLRHNERAHELTQEVFLKLWQMLQSGQTVTYERALLYTIAKRLFINEIRQKHVEISYDILAAGGFEIPDVTSDSTATATHRELWQYLQNFKESYREVLLLRYVDGLPVKDIAELLGEKETNISMRIARGIESLRQAYQTQSS